MNIVGKTLRILTLALLLFVALGAKAQVTGVSASHALITETNIGETFTITVDYTEVMNPTPVPSISFTPSVGGTLTSPGTNWATTKQLEFTWTIADGTEELADIDATITGGEDINGPLGMYTEADLFSIDNARPDPTISSSESDPTGASPVPIIINWDEPVTGFVVGDLAITGGTPGALSGSGAGPYTVDITPSGGEVDITVEIADDAGAIVDLAGNQNNASNSFSIEHDSVVPTVVISSSESSPTNASPIAIDIDFSEPVTGFTASEVVVTGGSKGSLTGSGANYAINVTPSGPEVTVTVDVAAGVATDGVNTNTAASQFVIVHDSQKPTPTISSSEPDPTTNSPITLDIVFDEPVTGLLVGEINVTGGTKGTLTGSGDTYSLDVTPSGTDVTITAIVSAGAATDGVNTSFASNNFSIKHDSEPPTIMSLAYDDDTHVIVTFSEDVDETTAESFGNYTFDNGVTASAADWNTGPDDEVTITVSNLRNLGLLEGGTTLEVTISNVEDEAGNVILPGSQETVVLPDKVGPQILPGATYTLVPSEDHRWYIYFEFDEGAYRSNGAAIQKQGFVATTVPSYTFAVDDLESSVDGIAAYGNVVAGHRFYRAEVHRTDVHEPPSGDFDLTLTVVDNSIYDDESPRNEAPSTSSTGPITIGDQFGPIISNALINSTNSYVDFELNEPVYSTGGASGGIDLSDIVLNFQSNGGNATGLAESSLFTTGDGGSTYAVVPVGGETMFRLSFTLTNPPASGDESILVQPTDDASWYDATGNATVKTDITAPVLTMNDLLPPTLSGLVLATDNPSGTRAKDNDNITLTFTASEPLNGNPTVVFSSGGIVMNNSVSINSSGAPTYVATIEVDNAANDTDGNVTYTVDFADANGNAGTQVTSGHTGSVIVDNTKPQISSITFSEPIISSTTLVQVATVAFDEPMQTGVKPTVTINGSNWTLDDSSPGLGWTDNQTFKAQFTHDGDEEEFTVNVSVAADEVEDIVGNNNLASATYNFEVDTERPEAAITYSDLDGYVRQGELLTITATFDEPMADAPVVQIALTGTNTLAPTNMVKSSTTVYTYVHTVGAGDGTVTVSLSTGTDDNGNLIKSTPSGGATFEVDNTAPMLVINPYTPNPVNYPEFNNLPLNQQLEVVFDEPVIGAGTNNINVKEVGGIDNLFSGSVIHPGTNDVVNWTPTLVEQKEYEVLLAAGSFVDRAGNAFAGNAGSPWNNLTSFGAPIIDPITDPSLCIGSDYVITGKFLTGVTKITFKGGAGAGDDDDVDVFTIDNDQQITLTVPLLALPGQIEFIKENAGVNPVGAPANGGLRSTLSNSIIVGPSQADVIVDPLGTGNTVCSEGVTNTGIQFDIQGGVAPYQVTYTEAGVIKGPIAYTPGQTIDVNPPNNGVNAYVLTDVKDANNCAVPIAQLGSLNITQVETTKITINPTTNPQNPVCLSSVGGTIDLTGTVTGDNQNVTWTTTNGTGNFTSVDNSGPSIDATYNFTPQDYALDFLTIRVTSVGSSAPCSEDFDEIDITFTLNRSVDLGPDLEVCYDSGGPNIIDLAGVLGGDADQGTWTAVTYPANPNPGGDGDWILNGVQGANPGLIGDGADGTVDGTMNIQYVLSTADVENGGVTIQLAPSGGSCGAPITGEIDVTINVLPPPTVISQSDTDVSGSPDHEICSGQTAVVYEVNNPSMSNFTWTIIDAPDGTTGTITAGQNTSKIFIDWGETVTTGMQMAQVEVVENATNGCDSDPVLIDVFINPRPDVTFNPAVTNYSLDAAPAELIGDPVPDNITTFGVFSGTGVVKDPNDDYFFNPAIAGINELHSITYTYTDANGCTNSAPPVDFTVFDASDAIIATATSLPIESAYCADAPSFEIQLSASFLSAQLSPGFEFSRFEGEGITDQGNQMTAILDPSEPFDLTLGGTIDVEYYQKRTIDGLETPLGSQSIVINPLPVPSPSDLSDASFCTDDDLIALTRDIVLNPTTAPGATFTFEIVGGDPDGLIETPSPEQYFLNPANAQFAPDDFEARIIEIRYYYINGNGCDDEFIMENISIFQQPPAPTLASTDICFTEDNPNMLSVIEPVPNADVIWYADASLSNVLQRSTSPDFEAPSGLANVEDYYVTQEINGCESPSTKVTVGRIPSFEFEGICAGTATNFTVLGDLSGISDLIWTIIDDEGQQISSDTLTTSLESYSYTFTDPGLFKVSLGSSICPNPNELDIFIVPSVTVTTEYLENFEGNSGWVPWGSDTPISSWENTVPSGNVINTGSKSWITNADGPFPSGENSFVYSPCFDISALNRPMVSFDIFKDMQSSAGVVLQYSTDGRFGTWNTIGTDNTGIEWYDERALTNVPGGIETNVFAFGWTEENSGWKNARYALDIIPKTERGSVIFRIAFNSSTNSLNEGFAFDNFRISEKYRLVVLEHFEDSSEDSQNQVETINEMIQDFSIPETDMIAIQYRTEANDALFTSEVNSRKEYYGFTSAPNAIFDGDSATTAPPASWFLSTYTYQSLVEPTVDIAITSGNNTGNTLQVQTEITARQDIASPFLVQIIVIEKDADGLANVVRTFLPSASGTKFSSLAVSDAPLVINEEWLISELSADERDLGIVVVVQDEQNQAVLQTAYLDVPDGSDTITGIEADETLSMKVFPNPVDHLLTVDFGGQEASTIRVFDQFGKLLFHQDLPDNSQSFQVNTSTYSSGVYFIQLEGTGTVLGREKFIVSH